MKPAKDLAASLRKMAAEFPLLPEEYEAVTESAGMLERIEEHVADMEQKGKACTNMAADQIGEHRARLSGKASVFTEEARRLRAITEGR